MDNKVKLLMENSYVADKSLMKALEKRSKPIPCSDGRILFSKGELPKGLYILRAGSVALLALPFEGEAVECVRVTASTLLCLNAVINNEPHAFTAVAGCGADVVFVTREDFESLLRSQPLLYPRVLDALAAQSRDAHKALSDRLG